MARIQEPIIQNVERFTKSQRKRGHYYFGKSTSGNGLGSVQRSTILKRSFGYQSKIDGYIFTGTYQRRFGMLQAISHLLMAEEEAAPGSVWDHGFIADKTQGFIDWESHIKSKNLDFLVEQSGISLDQIKETVAAIKNKKKIIACWAMGLTQHRNAVDTIKEVVNLLIAKGSIGKPGAGTCPVRGHSNVQGDRTMGIYEKPSKVFLDNLQRVFEFEPPREHGYDVVDCIKAMHEGKVRVFFAMEGTSFQPLRILCIRPRP